MFFTYVIENIDSEKIYIGQTVDLQKRLDRHNQKLVTRSGSYTKKNSTQNGWSFIYVEAYKTRQEVRLREKQLKSADGREFIKQFRRASSSVG